MSWESTAIYYRLLNEIVRERLGRLQSAKLLPWSFDFAEIADGNMPVTGNGAGVLLVDALCVIRRRASGAGLFLR
jgi:aspartate racemase